MKEIIKENLVKIGLIVLTILALITGLVFYSAYVNPDKLVTKNYNISSPKIPTQMDDVSIAYISDINYGEFSNMEYFDKLIKTINDSNAEVVLFGGDVFHDSKKHLSNPKTKKHFQEGLTKINAPLGKFFVLGDQDQQDKTAISNMFYNANFENLTNKNIQLHNHSNQYGINLVGIDNMVNGKVNLKKAFKGVNKQEFTIVFTHTPDIAQQINSENYDLLFGGHSHGRQVDLPFFTANKVKKGATTYQKGIHHQNNSTICVSNGVSTTETDVRFLSNNEIIVYTLHHQKTEN